MSEASVPVRGGPVEVSDCLMFAIPTTIIREPGVVRLVAGEDFRFTLRGNGLESWLPGLLEQLNGQRPVATVLEGVSDTRRAEALGLLERLVGERLLFAAESLPQSIEALVQAEGVGQLFERVRSAQPNARDALRVRTLCQDTLDYRAALEFNAVCRAGKEPWLWATLGPSARAFVSPVFWPDVGPCLACLLEGFKRLSPVPELYGALIAHGERGGHFASAILSEPSVALVANLVHGKVAMLCAPEPPPAVTRLHVVEAATLEVTAHRIPRDLECSLCHGDVEPFAR